MLPLILGGLILWWMYRGFDWTTLQAALTSDMNWTWMWLSFPFGILAQVFRGLRWRQSLQPLGEHPRLHTSVNAIFLSYASSLLVPRIGEVLRCGVVRRYDGVGFSRAVGTVVTERFVDMAIIAVLSIVVFIMQVPVFAAFVQRTGMSIGGLLGQFTTSGWIVTIVCAVVLLAFLYLLLRHLRLWTRTRSVLHELTEGLLSIRLIKGKGSFLFYSLAIWVCYFLHFYLTFFCFKSTEHLSMMVAMVAFVVGTFAVLVPTPNGAGPWHFAVKTVLVLYGVAGDDGALFALIVHTVQTLLVAVLGIYAVVALALTRPRPLPLTTAPSPTPTNASTHHV